MTTAHRIREARLRLDLSQEGFAHKLGVSSQTVSRWERGETVPRPRAVRLVSDLTGIPVDELAPDDTADAALAGDPDILARFMQALQESLRVALGETTTKGRRTALPSAAAAPSEGSLTMTYGRRATDAAQVTP